MTRYQYPKQVPVLCNLDFMCGASRCPLKRKHCLMEWVNIVFMPPGELEKKILRHAEEDFLDLELDRAEQCVPERVYETILRTAYKYSREHGLSFHDAPASWPTTTRDFVIHFNDSHAKPKHLAEVWNLAMQKLGYTEVEEVDA